MLSLIIIPDCEPQLSQEPSGWNNPMYVEDSCRFVRQVRLLGMNPEECNFIRRLIISILLGGLIGFERRNPDKPAGVRTMALASLGSCTFTICSGNAFSYSPMLWDSSRIAAAIPSGVGFLGAGLIWKGRAARGNYEVRGLTTAASVWLSSAVGVAVGGQLYVPAFFVSIWTVLVLRYGPRLGFLADAKDVGTTSTDWESKSENASERSNVGEHIFSELRSRKMKVESVIS
eukprot:g1771.t1